MQPLDAQRAAFIMFMRGVLHSSASVEQVVSDRSENHEGMGGMLRNDSPVAQVRSIGEGAASRRCRSIQAAAGQIACCPAPQAWVGCCVLRAYAQRQYELSCTMPSSALLWLLPPPMCALPPVPAGKETVRRLLDLPAACSLVDVDLDLPEGLTSVTTVGELAQLLAATKEHATVRAIVCSAARAPSAAAAAVVLLEGCPGNLQPEDRRAPAAAAPSAPRCRRLPHTPILHLVSQDLSQVLKLSKSQLETAAAHVATAVEPDTWLRVFLAPSGAGLLYSCDQGGCTLGEPAGGCCSKQGEGEAGSCAVHAAGVWLPNRRRMPRREQCMFSAPEGASVALGGNPTDAVPSLVPAAAVLECRRDDGGSLLPLAVQRLGPNPPELRRKESTLQQLVAQAEAAWHTSAHPGWEVLQLGGNCFEVGVLRCAVLRCAMLAVPHCATTLRGTAGIACLARVCSSVLLQSAMHASAPVGVFLWCLPVYDGHGRAEHVPAYLCPASQSAAGLCLSTPLCSRLKSSNKHCQPICCSLSCRGCHACWHVRPRRLSQQLKPRHGRCHSGACSRRSRGGRIRRSRRACLSCPRGGAPAAPDRGSSRSSSRGASRAQSDWRPGSVMISSSKRHSRRLCSSRRLDRSDQRLHLSSHRNRQAGRQAAHPLEHLRSPRLRTAACLPRLPIHLLWRPLHPPAVAPASGRTSAAAAGRCRQGRSRAAP